MDTMNTNVNINTINNMDMMEHINNLIHHNKEYANKHVEMENEIIKLKNIIAEIKQELFNIKEDNNNQLNIINYLQNNIQI